MQITLVTSLAEPELIKEDHALTEALKARGAEIAVAPWNGPFEPFQQADMVLIRTPWDYVNHAGAFLSWLNRLEEEGVRAVNDVALLKWNLNKVYLLELQEKGAPLPAMFVADPEPQQIMEQAREADLSDIVIKPVISAGSKGLSRVKDISLEAIAEAVSGLGTRVLVQPVIAEIQTLGETSLIFFGRTFSHAVCKKPVSGDIRCQSEFGGSVEAVEVPGWAQEKALSIIDMLPVAPLYARVDVIIRENDLLLMEVEVIEPELFFRLAPEAAELFARELIS